MLSDRDGKIYDMILDPVYFNLCRAGSFAILLFFVFVCFIFSTV